MIGKSPPLNECASPPRAILATAILGTALILGVSPVLVWRIQSLTDETQRRVAEAEQLAAQITQYDCELTTAARLAAATGLRCWEQRYLQTLPKLDACLTKLAQYEHEHIDETLDDELVGTNARLVALEREALRMTRAGQGAEALAMLSGAEYTREKQNYDRRAQAARDALSEDIQADTARVAGWSQRLVLMACFSGLLLGGTWFVTFQRVRRYIVALRDARDAASASGRFARGALDGLSAHIAVIDEHGTILEVNRQWREFARANGGVADAAVGVNYLEVCEQAGGESSEGAVDVAQGIRCVLSGTLRSFEWEYPCHGPDAQRWFRVRVTPFSGDGPVRLVIAHENVTARHHAEARLNLAVEAAQAGLWDWSVTGGTFVANKQFYELLGERSCCDARPLSWFTDRVHEEDRPRMLAAVERAHTDPGFQYRGEFRARLVGGTYRWMQSTGRVVERSSDGAPTRMTGFMFDIHQLKTVQGDLDRARRDAETANRAKSAFLANMSHEIRTPMTAVLGFVDVLSEEDLTPEERLEHLATIRSNGEHLLAVINDILDLTRIETGTFSTERVACSPMEVIADVDALLRTRAEAKRLEFEIECDEDIPETVLSDPRRLRQILVNLLGNAIKFTEHGTVRLRAHVEPDDDAGRCLQFDVIDSGPGMTDGQLSRIFAPFDQADVSTTRRFGGTGLGLAISERLAEALGGGITVVSRIGKGSVFRLSVPIVMAGRDVAFAAPPAESGAD